MRIIPIKYKQGMPQGALASNPDARLDLLCFEIPILENDF